MLCTSARREITRTCAINNMLNVATIVSKAIINEAKPIGSDVSTSTAAISDACSTPGFSGSTAAAGASATTSHSAVSETAAEPAWIASPVR